MLVLVVKFRFLFVFIYFVGEYKNSGKKKESRKKMNDFWSHGSVCTFQSGWIADHVPFTRHNPPSHATLPPFHSISTSRCPNSPTSSSSPSSLQSQWNHLPLLSPSPSLPIAQHSTAKFVDNR